MSKNCSPIRTGECEVGHVLRQGRAKSGHPGPKKICLSNPGCRFQSGLQENIIVISKGYLIGKMTTALTPKAKPTDMEKKMTHFAVSEHDDPEQAAFSSVTRVKCAVQ